MNCVKCSETAFWVQYMGTWQKQKNVGYTIALIGPADEQNY